MDDRAHAEQKGLKLWRIENPSEVQQSHKGGNGQWGSSNKRGSTSTISAKMITEMRGAVLFFFVIESVMTVRV